MKSRLVCVFSVLLSGTVLPAVLPAADSANGQMTVDSNTISLTNARAIEVPNPQGGNYIRVLVSDHPVSEDELKLFPDVLLSKISSGKLNALSFLVVENNSVHSIDIFSSAFGDGISEETLSTGNLLELRGRDASHISGRLHIESAHRFSDIGKTFRYDITFEAPIQSNE